MVDLLNMGGEEHRTLMTKLCPFPTNSAATIFSSDAMSVCLEVTPRSIKVKDHTVLVITLHNAAIFSSVLKIYEMPLTVWRVFLCFLVCAPGCSGGTRCRYIGALII